MDRLPTHSWVGWGVTFGATLGVVVLALLPPFLGETARGVIMQAFAGVCHQLPARSPQIGGLPLAVCDRCLGIYGGLALGVIGYLPAARWQACVYRHAGLVLGAALVPLAVDWAGPMLGLWTNVPLSRAVTGALFGGAAGYLLARAAVHYGRPATAPTRRSGGEGAERTAVR